MKLRQINDVETLHATSLQFQGRGTLREALRAIERGFKNKLHIALSPINCGLSTNVTPPNRRKRLNHNISKVLLPS